MGKKKQTIGYKYYMSLHAVLCRGPVDKIKKIFFKDKLAWEGEITANQTIFIDNKNLFGGEEKEGGVAGYVDVMMGAEDQLPNPFLQSRLGNGMPAFRGVVGLVFKSFYFSAMTAYFKQPSIEMERIPMKDWMPDIANIGGAANPVHCILEMLTHPEWGMGYSQSDCNMPSFQAVAQKLFDEGFGLSFSIKSDDDYEKIIQMIMTHVNGLFYVNPSNGLFNIKLLRGGYEAYIEDLELLDESNSELINYERPSYSEVINEIVLTYKPLGSIKADVISVQNLAAVQAQGGVISQSVSYPAIGDKQLAMQVANRDLRQKSTPLAKVKIKTNRKAWFYTPGDLFRLNWTEYGIDTIVFRIVEIDYGTLENGAITIDAVEDIFGLSAAQYLISQESLWVDESADAADIVDAYLVEAPYWDVARTLGESAAEALDPDTAYLESYAAKQPYYSSGFELWTPTGSGSLSPSLPEYPLYDVRLNAAITDTDIVITASFLRLDFYWVDVGSTITISDGTNSEDMVVVAITDDEIIVESRSGFAFSEGSYINLGYGSNNPIALGMYIDDTDTTIDTWLATTNAAYIVVGEYYLIDEEIIKIVSYSSPFGNTGILRAQMGTTAVEHFSGHYMRRIYQPDATTSQYEFRSAAGYAPSATIFAATDRKKTIVTGFNIKGEVGQIRLGSYALWDSEIVRVTSVSNALLILGRGCLDTVPVNHSTNSKIYFAEDFLAASSYEYLQGETVDAKLRTQTPKGILALSDATTESLEMIGRLGKPYPPGKFRINTEAYPEVISGELQLTWASRNRLLQVASIIDESASSVSPEDGTEYGLKIYGETDILLKDTVVSGLSYNFTDEVAISDLWDETSPYTEFLFEDAETTPVDWVCYNTGFAGAKAKGLCFDGTNFIAQMEHFVGSSPIVVKHDGMVISSTPEIWSEVATITSADSPDSEPIDQELEYLVGGDGIFVDYGLALGLNTGDYRLSDLENWEYLTFPSSEGDQFKTAPLWNGSEFVTFFAEVVGAPDERDNPVLYSSTDGETWSSGAQLPDSTNPIFTTDKSISATYLGLANGLHLAVYLFTDGADVAFSFYTSSDLATWTEVYSDTLSLEDAKFMPVVYSNSLWMIARKGEIGGATTFMSSDGSTWNKYSWGDMSLTLPSSMADEGVFDFTSNTVVVDGSYFYIGMFRPEVIGVQDFAGVLIRSDDGETWVEYGADILPGIGGSSFVYELFAKSGTRIVAAIKRGTVTTRLIVESNDTGATWKVTYPLVPQIEQNPTDPLDGTYSFEMSRPSGAYGHCYKEVGGIDYNTCRVNLSFKVLATTGQTPTIFALDERTVSAEVKYRGFGIEFDPATDSVRLKKYSDDAITTLFTITDTIDFDTEYKVEFSIERNAEATLSLYDEDDNLIVTDTQTIIGLGTSTRNDAGQFVVWETGLYDNMLLEVQQQTPRYNSSLRIELNSVRDGIESYTAINYTTTRTDTSV